MDITVVFKIHFQRAQHLQPLRKHLRRSQVTTRAVVSVPEYLSYILFFSIIITYYPYVPELGFQIGNTNNVLFSL